MLDSIYSFITWNASPEIFSIGNFALRWYGLLFALGFLVGQQILIRIYKGEGRSEKDVETLTIYMVVATVLGARLGHVLFYQPDYYWENPAEILMIWKGGLASHGAALGILIAIYLYSKKATHQSYFYVLDRLVITIAFAGCLIRLGNLMNSEIIGKPTNFPTAFVFVNDAKQGLMEAYPEIVRDVEFKENKKDTTMEGFAYQGLDLNIYLKPGNYNKESLLKDILTNLRTNKYYYENILTPTSYTPKIDGDILHIRALGIPRHPAQLYEAISCMLLFLILIGMYLKTKEKTPEGRLFSVFVVVVFGLRFFYEFLKEPQVDFESTMTLNMGQILSIPLVIIGIYMFLRSFKKKNEII